MEINYQFMDILQFGEEIKDPIVRVSVYGVILNESNQILVVNVRGKYHLPGGGIDEGEEEKQALVREVLEETGYEITDLQFVGKANQFLPNASIGPMNKLGTFYFAHAGRQDVSRRVEMDHSPEWMSFDKLETAPMSEFQKWAIVKVFDELI